MKKVKQKKLILNKIKISHIQIADRIYGGSGTETELESECGNTWKCTNTDCNETNTTLSGNTQGSLTTGEVTTGS